MNNLILSSGYQFVSKVLIKSKARYAMTIGDVFRLSVEIQRTHNPKGNDVVRLKLSINDNREEIITMNEADRLLNDMIEFKEYNEKNVFGEK